MTGGIDVPRISISAACFAGAPNGLALTQELARELKTGVEWQPGRETPTGYNHFAPRVPTDMISGVTSLHAPWGTVLEHEHCLWREGFVQHCKARYFARELGTVESNPCFSIALGYNLPVVVHHGTLEEAHALVLEGSFGVWHYLGTLAGRGLLLIENDERAIYPWLGGRRSSAARWLSAFEGLDFPGLPLACLDIGHLYVTDGGSGPLPKVLSVMLDALRWRGIALVEAHVHDIVDGRDHLAFGPGANLPLARVISRLCEEAPGINLVVETPGGIPDALRRRFLGQREAIKTADDVRRSVEFTRKAAGL